MAGGHDSAAARATTPAALSFHQTVLRAGCAPRRFMHAAKTPPKEDYFERE
jgi:hypothetical protein